MNRLRLIGQMTLLAGCTLLVVGCGGTPDGITVKGKLVTPPGLKLLKDDNIQIDFFPANDAGSAATAQCTGESLEFTLNRGVGEGVLAGDYKVSVMVQAYPGSQGIEKRRQVYEKINNDFNRDTTPLKYSIPSGSPSQTHNLTVDLAKKAVTAN
ncbi:hypothetical protein [Tuwongella immobilis]|uniref:Lipoprotein n=1 Tax=Tuwongella immobilis TaxID=692036 RepID=A0A6C2YPE2_9BACT|nr:hypothetical protein [Tuwongella immobilis]VIP02742.1 unnamed protein product [Tuwongella immobilis]VTS02316.1 unnamed protein product [Tuwongella immobilis]